MTRSYVELATESSKVLQDSQEKYKNFFMKFMSNSKRYLFGVFIFLVVVMVMASVKVFMKSSKDQFYLSQNKKTDVMLNELNNISSEVEQLSVNPHDSKQSQQELKEISSDIKAIKESIPNISKSSDISQVSGQMESIKSELDSRLSEIKRIISDNLGNKEYLDQSVLPFQVESVDVIGGFPYVSVSYENHIMPLGISDDLAGWHVSVADFDTETAEFVNSKKQFVKVSMQGISHA